MAPPSRKRKPQDLKGRPKKLVKKFKKQTDYDSGSGDEDENLIDPSQDFKAVNLAERSPSPKPQEQKQKDDDALIKKLEKAAKSDSDDDESEDEDDPSETQGKGQGDEFDINAIDSSSEVTDASTDSENNNDDDEGDDSQSDNDPSHPNKHKQETNPNLIKKKKRHDPDVFASTMKKILDSGLSKNKKSDPIVSRSKSALEASREMTDQALEKKARTKLSTEKRLALEKGRVRDVIGASSAFDTEAGVVDAKAQEGGGGVAETQAMERRLKKTAQRGVVKLFNAVRAAQVKGEEAQRDSRNKGTVGFQRREEKVNEMSKQGFLDLIAGGGGGLKAGGVEEA